MLLYHQYLMTGLLTKNTFIMKPNAFMDVVLKCSWTNFVKLFLFFLVLFRSKKGRYYHYTFYLLRLKESKALRLLQTPLYLQMLLKQFIGLLLHYFFKNIFHLLLCLHIHLLRVWSPIYKKQGHYHSHQPP